ncbi:MAG: efflux RND transporter periplasmic adaptor subunit [Planctomycetota bacterium]
MTASPPNAPLARSLPARGRAFVVTCHVLVIAACGAEDEVLPGGMPPPAEVTVARPLVRPIVEWDRYTARVEPLEEVAVRARVSGYLQSLHFRGGALVEAGDLLAVIDPRPFEASLARARAEREEAKAERASAAARRAQALAASARATAARQLATSRLENAQSALATNAIAREQVDVRTSELAQADAEVAAADASVALAEADIIGAEAAVASADAAVEQAELELSYTRILAPIAGRAGDRLVTRGNLIQGGIVLGTALTSIVSLDPIRVTFDADEQEFLKYVRLARSGQRRSSRDVKNPVYVSLLDEEGYPHTGHMDFVDNRIDPATGTMRASAILRNPDGELTPGMFATLRLPGSARYDALLLPDEAVIATQATRSVYVLDAADVPQPRAIELGPLIDGLRVVRSGLESTDLVVVNGLQRIRPGQPVAPTLVELEAEAQDDGLPNDYQPVPESDWIRSDDGTPR